MQQRFEYTFVRFGEHWLSEEHSDQKSLVDFSSQAAEDYQYIIREHALEGWRLVQIFAPERADGHPHYYELIFERPLE
jgi:hypothetical protein